MRERVETAARTSPSGETGCFSRRLGDSRLPVPRADDDDCFYYFKVTLTPEVLLESLSYSNLFNTKSNGAKVPEFLVEFCLAF